jgi:hypothetical protein
MHLTLRLFEQGMQEGIRANTTGTVNNMLLVKDMNGFILQVESTCLVQTKSEGIIHFKNDVGTSVAGPKGTSWVK